MTRPIEAGSRSSGRVFGEKVVQWILADAGMLLGILAGGIWLLYEGDIASPLFLAMTGIGAVGSDSFTRKWLRREGCNHGDLPIPERPLMEHLKMVFHLGLAMLEAQSVELKLWNTKTGQCVDWRAKRSGKIPELAVTKPGPCLRPARQNFGSAIYVRKGQSISCVGLDQNGRKPGKSQIRAHLKELWHGPFETLLLGYVRVGANWEGVVAYLDAPVSSRPVKDLRRLQQIVDIATSGAGLYKTAGDSARAGERQRLARDLHDGVTQSLIATEMQLAMLERGKPVAEMKDQNFLDNVREILRGETKKLRVQIADLKYGESSEPVRVRLHELLRQFEQESTIEARLHCDTDDRTITPFLTYELMCLVQEGLSNIRKHSGAARVEVTLHIGEKAHLCIQDDGCGFDFSGRYDLSELQSMRQGPRSIRERVRGNGGDMFLETGPGAGTRLDIALPLDSAQEYMNRELKVSPPEIGGGLQPISMRKQPQSAQGVRRMMRTS